MGTCDSLGQTMSTVDNVTFAELDAARDACVRKELPFHAPLYYDRAVSWAKWVLDSTNHSGTYIKNIDSCV